MVTNYYNPSNNFSSPVRREPKPYSVPQNVDKCETEKKDTKIKIQGEDTLLFLGLIAILLITGCRDKLLLIALLYLVMD